MIAIVLTTWNHLATTTRPCLDSIRRFTGVPYRVICVDNGSTDETRGFLEAAAREDPRLEFVTAPENLGWAGGTLAGLRRLRPGDAHVCLLNSDTIVTPRWLARLAAHLEADPGLTLVIPDESPPGRRSLRDTPMPPSLHEILDAAARAERRHRGRSRPAPPSGFCALMRRREVENLADYLRQFERFHSGELDWRDFWRERRGRCRMALDTYVFHARGGSGGYYRYNR